MRKFLLSFFVIIIGSTTTFLTGATKVSDISGLQILTPTLKERKTEKIRLDNGLGVYLISDPNTPESGAALAVHVGTWDDPETRPGMAHFVEHLLFLGTEKYPDESGYTRFLDEHAGARNAFTSADRTVFMFSCENPAFLEALDRFSEFFISPLFNPSGVARELMAINQEFIKDQMVEFWRAILVKKELSNPNHPFHRFDIGNAETLKSISRDELIAWFYSHYSSDKMDLVVISSLPIETLKQEVITKFEKVEKRKVSSIHPKEAIFTPDTANTLVVIRPIHESRTLELTWELPLHLTKDKETKPATLISYVLGHEGENSLLAKLKKKGMAIALSVQEYHAGKEQSFLILRVELTDMGVQNTHTVIEECYQTLAFLKKYGIPRYIFDETRQIASLSYLFQNRNSVFREVTEYACCLVDEELETFPLKSLMPTTYSAEKIDALLSSLTPRDCRYTLTAPIAEGYWKKERWMGVEYALFPITEENIKQWEEIGYDTTFALPPPNRFLPHHLECKEKCSENLPLYSPPHLALENTFGKIYQCSDDRFGLPNAAFEFTIYSPLICSQNAKTQATLDLFCEIVDHRLGPLVYEARLGGLEYALTPTYHGLRLTVKGYDQKVEPFLTKILEVLTTIDPQKQELTVFTEHLKREYYNQLNDSPVRQGTEALKGILYKNYCGPCEKLTQIDEISMKDMKAFCQQIFEKTYIEGMLFGDFPVTTSESVWKLLEGHLVKEAFPPAMHQKTELVDLTHLRAPSYLSQNSSLDGNGLILTIDCGKHDFKKEAVLSLLAKGLEEPFFSELRTKQQTAYIVGNYFQEIEGHLYAFFIIQSSSHTTRDLLSRFELFLENALQHMNEQVITRERFSTIKQASIVKLETSPQSPIEMAASLSDLVFNYSADFDWPLKQIEAMKELSYEEFVQYSSEFIGKSNLKRIAICIDGNQAEKGTLAYRKIVSLKTIEKEINYQPK